MSREAFADLCSSCAMEKDMTAANASVMDMVVSANTSMPVLTVDSRSQKWLSLLFTPGAA
eukprot:3937947-Rhodomonas_salina.1